MSKTYFDIKLLKAIDRFYDDALNNDQCFDLTRDVTVALEERLPQFLRDSFGYRVDQDIEVEACSYDIDCDENGRSYHPLRNYWLTVRGNARGVEAKTIGLEIQQFLISQGVKKEDAEYTAIRVTLK